MIESCERAGVQLAVIFQNRLSKDVFKVRRAIEAGLPASRCSRRAISIGIGRKPITMRTAAGVAPGRSTVAAP